MRRCASCTCRVTRRRCRRTRCTAMSSPRSATSLPRARPHASRPASARRASSYPGFSFGKATEHNLRLLARLDAIAALGYPVLVGLSRKSSLGRITGETPDDRLPASLTGAILAVQRGARIVRVHEVAATRNALAVIAAVERQQ